MLQWDLPVSPRAQCIWVCALRYNETYRYHLAPNVYECVSYVTIRLTGITSHPMFMNVWAMLRWDLTVSHSTQCIWVCELCYNETYRYHIAPNVYRLTGITLHPMYMRVWAMLQWDFPVSSRTKYMTYRYHLTPDVCECVRAMLQCRLTGITSHPTYVNMWYVTTRRHINHPVTCTTRWILQWRGLGAISIHGASFTNAVKRYQHWHFRTCISNHIHIKRWLLLLIHASTSKAV